MKNLGRFLFSALIILFSVIIVDIVAGKVLNWMLPQISVKTAMGKTYFALNEVEAPVVIVGSSRASHHYVTQIIEDSLGMDAYNVGRNGCYFNYNVCVINSILDRYTPEIIIWENSSSYLYENSDDPLENMYPYYKKNPWVTQVVNAETEWDVRIYLMSNLYRYNSVIHRIVLRWIEKNNLESDVRKGYEPLTPRRWIAEKAVKKKSDALHNIDKFKIEMLRKIFERTQWGGVKLIYVESPIFSDNQTAVLSGADNEVKKMALEYGVCYVDNRNLDVFVGYSEYFNDRTHLNSIGAETYTKTFIGQLRNKRILTD